MDARIVSVDRPSPAAVNGAVGCPASAPGCPIMSSQPAPLAAGTASLGRHLARRLVQVGVGDVFAVPGDFNLMLSTPAGYAADGYASARGVGACAVTFTVGGLSVLNAIAGAYIENLPVICIAGGPNSNDYGTNRILHHTIGVPNFSQELRCFQTVTCHQAVVTNLDDAREQIDTAAIATALRESKPVYLSNSCNLPGIPHPTFTRDPVPFFLAPRISNKMGLEAAVEATVQFVNKAVKPVLVGGPKLRVAKAQKAFIDLVDASGQGPFPETHPHFTGTYWVASSIHPRRELSRDRKRRPGEGLRQQIWPWSARPRREPRRRGRGTNTSAMEI
ncbi:hypothetical protein QYE76_054298 [Lolium multiflorum]|uniref:pyruvate decarboxylase n=1 Tax=Lolium multiflorum TaxID=4521 RepID=A0AAD8SY09_LOLMU|nr:hypothetical protein QYE76_054298 [Lolium multiflorum]